MLRLCLLEMLQYVLRCTCLLYRIPPFVCQCFELAWFGEGVIGSAVHACARHKGSFAVVRKFLKQVCEIYYACVLYALQGNKGFLLWRLLCSGGTQEGAGMCFASCAMLSNVAHMAQLL